jgi:hypothetical protein
LIDLPRQLPNLLSQFFHIRSKVGQAFLLLLDDGGWGFGDEGLVA